jgi:outer membrane cobalamin receptor
LLRRPASSGGGSVTWRSGAASLSTNVNYVGRRDDVDFRDFPSTRTGLPSYTTVDVAAELPVLRTARHAPEVDLTVRAENLFGAVYEQTVGFPGRGRTLLGGARVRF